jgi:uncharacterized protein (DUF488 family)
MNIFTIGYERADLDDFIAILREAQIHLVLDIRENPVSRRRGYSKQALNQALAGAGVAYRHEKSLGTPRPIREQLQRDNDYAAFFRAFDRYLLTQVPLLQSLAESLEGNIALLCYERDPAQCHRSAVARVLGDMTGQMPKHLGVSLGRI